MQKRKLIYPILLAALMGMIFFFSSQPSQESDETSGHFTTLAAHLFISNLDEFDPEIQAKIIDGFSFIVRKTAHFCEYALMGCLWYLWLRDKKGAPLWALLASSAFSCTDEFHQSFVPGRSCELRDVLVDSSGALAGILFGFLVVCVVYYVGKLGVRS